MELGDRYYRQTDTNLSKYNNLRYDIIVGRDLMKKIGMIVEFKNEKLIWGDVIVPV